MTRQKSSKSTPKDPVVQEEDEGINLLLSLF